MRSQMHAVTRSKASSGSWIAVVLAALLASAARAQDSRGEGSIPRQPAQVPQAPLDLVYARPYEVEEAMDFVVDGKKSKVKRGWVLILKADVALLEPKNAPDFALFAGGAVAQKINCGYKDGHIVVIVPECDLHKTSVWFGSRLVPERIDAATMRREKELARAAGIRPFPEKVVTSACEAGGEEPQLARDLNELWYLQARWILRYAPAEAEMARSLRPGRR